MPNAPKEKTDSTLLRVDVRVDRAALGPAKVARKTRLIDKAKVSITKPVSVRLRKPERNKTR